MSKVSKILESIQFEEISVEEAEEKIAKLMLKTNIKTILAIIVQILSIICYASFAFIGLRFVFLLIPSII